MAKSLDITLSKEIAAKSGAAIKECYRNSVMALSLCPQGAVYVEGTVEILVGLVVQHGWIEFKETIIDVTAILRDDAAGWTNYKVYRTYTEREIVEIMDAAQGDVRLPFAEHMLGDYVCRDWRSHEHNHIMQVTVKDGGKWRPGWF